MMHVYQAKHFMHENSWPDDYQLVAKVKGNDKELAFELTNHIDKDWTTNDHPRLEVIRSAKGSMNYRSTSVGDIVVDADGLIYRVELTGWKVIGDEFQGIYNPTAKESQP